MYDEETRNDNENVLNVSEKVHSKDEEPNFSLGVSISSQVWLVCFWHYIKNVIDFICAKLLTILIPNFYI